MSQALSELVNNTKTTLEKREKMFHNIASYMPNSFPILKLNNGMMLAIRKRQINNSMRYTPIRMAILKNQKNNPKK